MRRNWILRVTLLLILFLMVVSSDTARPDSSPIQQPTLTPFVLRLISDPNVKEVQEAHFMIKAEHPTGIKAGTGVAVDQELILTVFHLVGSNETGEVTATEIRISQPHMPWKERYALAEVAATDPSLDLAVLEFEPHRELPSLSFGDPSRLRPGQVVYLIGHEFFPDGVGLIYPRDAEIVGDYPPESPFFGVTPPVIRGFSGGGVFNLQNELVGIAIKDYILFDTIKDGGRTYEVVKQGTIVTKMNRAIQLLEEAE
jgi:S1-C subfamily serine protease